MDTLSWYRYHEDRLVIRTRRRDPATGRCWYRFRGKRVGRDCPLTREEIRAYVREGPVAAVKAIRARLGCGLAEAKDLLDRARRYT